MSRLFEEAMPAKFGELNLDERRDLIGQLSNACGELTDLAGCGNAVLAQDQVRDVATRLAMTIHVLKLAVGEMNVRYTDNACAMAGLLDILSKLGEEELNSVHLLTLLQPHHEHLKATHTMFDECLAG